MLSRGVAFNRATMLVGSLMMLGLAATFVREVLFARVFGTGHEIESFRLAFAIPNLLGTSLATTIVVALLPTLTKHRQDHGRDSAALSEAIATTGLLAVVLGTIGWLTSDWQVAAMAPGFDASEKAALTRHIRILWLFFAVLALSFGPRAFLSMLGTIWPMASANLVLGGTMALGLVLLTHAPSSLQTASSVAWLAVAAASMVVFLHILALPRRTLGNVWADRQFMAGRFLSLTSGSLFVVLVGHLLSASPRLFDRSVGTELGSGTVAALDFSYSVITVPGIALGSVFVIAAAPRFSAAIQAGRWPVVAFLGRRALLCGLLALASGGLLSWFAEEAISLVYAGGAFDGAAVELTTRILTWHAAALGPMVATIILSQAILTLGLVRLFFIVAAMRVIGKWVGLHWLVPAYGIDGLAASFLVPEILSTIVLVAVIWNWYRNRANT